jgi:cytochrome c-type biogenesis protein CcmH
MKRVLLMTMLALLMLSPQAWAVNPDEMLKDPALEARARVIGKDLRCLVCQNQSIDDSNAELARDLRVLVRDRILAGDSNEQVIDYVVSRYGDFVLLNPPMKKKTLLLWYGPVIILGLGVVAIFVFYRRRRHGTVDATAGAVPLSDAERAKIDKIMDGDR